MRNQGFILEEFTNDWSSGEKEERQIQMKRADYFRCYKKGQNTVRLQGSK